MKSTCPDGKMHYQFKWETTRYFACVCILEKNLFLFIYLHLFTHISRRPANEGTDIQEHRLLLRQRDDRTETLQEELKLPNRDQVRSLFFFSSFYWQNSHMLLN